MKHLILFSLFLVSFSNLFPCSCLYKKKISKKQVRQYQAIATGTIENVEEKDDVKLITFKVETIYKGKVSQSILKVYTALDGGMCGISAKRTPGGGGPACTTKASPSTTVATGKTRNRASSCAANR